MAGLPKRRAPKDPAFSRRRFRDRTNTRTMCHRLCRAIRTIRFVRPPQPAARRRPRYKWPKTFSRDPSTTAGSLEQTSAGTGTSPLALSARRAPPRARAPAAADFNINNAINLKPYTVHTQAARGGGGGGGRRSRAIITRH